MREKKLPARPKKHPSNEDRLAWLIEVLGADQIADGYLNDPEEFCAIQRHAYDLFWEWTKSGVIDNKKDFRRVLDAILTSGHRAGEYLAQEDVCW